MHAAGGVIEHDVVRVNEVQGHKPRLVLGFGPCGSQQPVGCVSSYGAILLETFPDYPMVIAVHGVFMKTPRF